MTSNPISAGEFKAILENLNDPSTGRPDADKIKALPATSKDLIVEHLISTKRPIITDYVTPNPDIQLKLDQAGYMPGYENAFFKYYVLPAQASVFKKSTGAPAEPPKQTPVVKTQAMPATPRVRVSDEDDAMLKELCNRLAQIRKTHTPSFEQAEKINKAGIGRRIDNNTTGFTQDQLAFLVGIARTRMSEIEAAKVNLTVFTLFPILRELNCKLSIH